MLQSFVQSTCSNGRQSTVTNGQLRLLRALSRSSNRKRLTWSQAHRLLVTGGQGRGRTADLPLFRRTLIPTELPDLTRARVGPEAERSRRDLNPRPPP